MLTILIVDDEPPIQRLLRATLEAQGWRTVSAATAREAVAFFRASRPDVVLLDLGLPDADGMDVLAQLRAEAATPVVVLSSRGEEAAKVAALDAGADDYVTKPFGAAELLARIRTAVRHRLQEQGAAPEVCAGPLSVDLARRRASVEGRPIKLSPKEFQLLEQFAIHAGKVLTHRHLLQKVWGDAAADPQYLRVYIRQLRQKIEADPDSPRLLLTEPGIGYRLEAPA